MTYSVCHINIFIDAILDEEFSQLYNSFSDEVN